MNLIPVILAGSLPCAAVAFYTAAGNRGGHSRTSAPQRPLTNTTCVLLRGWVFLPFVLVLYVVSTGRTASAQEIIHARAGQLIAMNSLGKTLTLKVADGSTVVFKDVADPAPAMSFDKDVRSKTVAPGAFHTVGAYVIVFYFGFTAPTAVAIENLGTGAPARMTGTVAGFDRHKHLLTLKTDEAKPQELAVSDDTIVETAEGVVRASEFNPSKGEQLRCFAKPQAQLALFLAPN